MSTRQRQISLSAAVAGHLRYIASAYSPNTYSDYERTHRLFMAYVGEKPLRQVCSGDVEGFLIHMRETPIVPAGVAANTWQPKEPRYRRPKTILNLHVALSALWTWALKRGYVDENIMRNVPKPRVNQEPIVPLTAQEVVQLIHACTESRSWHNKPLVRNYRPSAERDKAIIALFVETAVRVSELCHLRYRDVEFQRHGGAVHIDLGKGSKSRRVPFSKQCANLLQEYLLTRPDIEPDNALFVNIGRNEGLPMKRGSVQLMVRRLGLKVGLKVSPHKLRTTAACMLVCNGATAWQLQEIMGHADIKTTMRYVRAAQIDLDAAMRKASPLDNLRL
ncbi:MAG TPA: hypothetical protein EYP41_06855 [Anaerolineae bacterium]|nr:hypothetical protein [Anaerolineae bacterium]